MDQGIGLGTVPDWLRRFIESGGIAGAMGMEPAVAPMVRQYQRQQEERPTGPTRPGDPGWQDAVDTAGNFDFTGPIGLGMPLLMGGIKGYHATFDDFDNFDFRKVGETTRGNVTDPDPNSWAMRLARLGAWFADDDVSGAMAAPIVKEAELVGGVREFGSLDELSDFVEAAGGAMKARRSLRGEGFDLVKVADEEFGTNSYVALHPRAIESLRTKRD